MWDKKSMSRFVLHNSATPILCAVVLSLLIPPRLVCAEVSCSVEVRYQWKKDAADRPVVWAVVLGRGDSEDAAKARVSALVEAELPRARQACAREHENLAGCISAKFAASSSLLPSLDFSARKALEEAITSDCKAAQGVCGEAAGAEPKCTTGAPAVEASAGKVEDKGKESPDAKKKKK
jgi:hypothetical protein